MNKIIIIGAILIAFSEITIAQTKTGADRDKHGCIPSAGFTYSQIKKECIQIFNEDIRLTEVKPKKSYTAMAAVIFSKDHKKAEVFLPDFSAGQIFLRTGTKNNYSWKKGSYVLSNRKGYEIRKNKKLIYSSNIK